MPPKEAGANLCPHCGAPFDSPTQLKDHIESKHTTGIQAQERRSKEPGVEPADGKPTTELQPGAQTVRDTDAKRRK
jgi:hypothetical protein